jgi:hypothetical protein
LNLQEENTSLALGIDTSLASISGTSSFVLEFASWKTFTKPEVRKKHIWALDILQAIPYQ